jgi:hypothetical protein
MFIHLSFQTHLIKCNNTFWFNPHVKVYSLFVTTRILLLHKATSFDPTMGSLSCPRLNKNESERYIYLSLGSKLVALCNNKSPFVVFDGFFYICFNTVIPFKLMSPKPAHSLGLSNIYLCAFPSPHAFYKFHLCHRPSLDHPKSIGKQ